MSSRCVLPPTCVLPPFCRLRFGAASSAACSNKSSDRWAWVLVPSHSCVDRQITLFELPLFLYRTRMVATSWRFGLLTHKARGQELNSVHHQGHQRANWCWIFPYRWTPRTTQLKELVGFPLPRCWCKVTHEKTQTVRTGVLCKGHSAPWWLNLGWAAGLRTPGGCTSFHQERGLMARHSAVMPIAHWPFKALSTLVPKT